ncbi:Na(+)/H(+) antiporter subunit C [Sinomonas sp. ASV486]|uniref:Na(+)/H(+) antiporter subunit C n=1 Tax=Sinomonas puerhi TaxID=3238584 RepID=A0AB39L1S8_9MICC|nr:Na(+)/H(+) antiporter subunit C [Sinomonas sp. ASV486]MDQ4491661.1 Na(+)/H(+) antiporter subunit C [Sinomonas sp. ASV486]
MTINLTLTVVAGLLFAAGIYLLLERSLTRVLLGLMLLTNGANVLLLATGGKAGLAPLIVKGADPSAYNDPLPQALILTSIVISFAVTAFMLALIYRTWQLGRGDIVADDIEDRRVAAQPSWHAEDDADVPVDLSEFPIPEAAAAADREALAMLDPRTHAAQRKEATRE